MDLARSRGWQDDPFPSDQGRAVTGARTKSGGAESPARYADHTMTGKALARLGIAGLSTAAFIELAKLWSESQKRGMRCRNAERDMIWPFLSMPTNGLDSMPPPPKTVLLHATTSQTAPDWSLRT